MRSLIAILSLIAATAAAEPVPGVDYQLLQPPQRPGSPGRIEVIEFFSYGCPHCAALHERITAWAAELPADVVFRRVAVGFGRPAWINLARAYYALEATGDLGRLDAALYAAVHEERLPLVDEKRITAWVAGRDVDPEAFAAAFGSFGVDTQVARAEALTRSYRIGAVPTITVAGRYAVLGHSEEQMLATIDALVAKSRSDPAAASRTAPGKSISRPAARP